MLVPDDDPVAILLRRLRQSQWRAVDRQPDHRAPLRRLLKYGLKFAAGRHRAYDQWRALRSQIADLHVALSVDRDRKRVGRVVRLAPQIDRVARLAERNVETPRRTTLVRMVGADDCEGEGAHLGVDGRPLHRSLKLLSGLRERATFPRGQHSVDDGIDRQAIDPAILHIDDAVLDLKSPL